MKQIYFFLLFFIFYVQTTLANPVSVATAHKVAAHILHSNVNLAYTAETTDDNGEKRVLFFVFNQTDNKGFVIIAGDDAAVPILGYSDESNFDAKNVPINMQKWLEGYKAELRYIIQNKFSSNAIIQQQWDDIINNEQVQTRSGVNPLLTTQWDQAPYFNALCPYDNVDRARTLAGCVATAMAQVMKFWNHPARGVGSHTYTDQNYGRLSANFGTASYAWSSMPNRLSSPNTAVATLLYHCGVSVDMKYGTTASGAYVINGASPTSQTAEYALKTYFGYNPTSLRSVQRSNYVQSQWIHTLKVELDARRPILYIGLGGGGGHAFVCDGYNDRNFFHFNWGWGGQSDGYFFVDALNPGSLGAGGGTGGFNSGQAAIIGIQPNSNNGGGNTQEWKIQLHTDIAVEPDPILYDASFSVSANIINKGTRTFKGEITAALFDEDYEFVDYIETLTESTGLQSNYRYQNPLQFDSEGISEATPGDYYIGIFIKPQGSDSWIKVEDGSYENFIPITITSRNDNNVKLYDIPITVASARLTPKGAIKGRFNVANYGDDAFEGLISVDLHDEDGDLVQTIIEEEIDLCSECYFRNALSFEGTLDDVEPGTYQLAVWIQPEGGEWEMVGSAEDFYNPIEVIISEPALNPDIYENNNTETTARALSLNFSNNKAQINTSRSNSHIGTDYDYYKISLPAGYKYTIQARVHDSFDSDDGNEYTNDVLFSYKQNNGAWSDAFDDVPAGDIIINGGSTLSFLVSPYYQGETGTYLLDVKITRSTGTATFDKALSEFVLLYPNPVTDRITLTLPAGFSIAENWQIFNVTGQLQREGNLLKQTKEVTISTDGLASGSYFLVLETDKGWVRKKFVVIN